MLDFSEGFPQALWMIETKKVGGIWHGYLEGHPEVDERGLTEDVARRKVERVLDRLQRSIRFDGAEATVLDFPQRNL